MIVIELLTVKLQSLRISWIQTVEENSKNNQKPIITKMSNIPLKLNVIPALNVKANFKQ